MNLLLALDNSPSSEIALDEVAARPWPRGTVVCVLSVVDLFALASGLSAIGALASLEVEANQATANKAAEKLSARGLEATTKIIEGYPPTAILEYAKECAADFVIVGSHGHSRIATFLLGSTAKAVVRGAPCSVEIVREVASSRPMKVLLATDGSEFSDAAVESIARRPWPDSTEVKIVSALDLAVPSVDPWYAATEVMEELRDAAVERAQEAIRAAKEKLSASKMPTSEAVLTGHPKAVILEVAREWGADLIIVGSHGRRGISRLMLGSVSETVALHAHCSVEVIRPPRQA
jgi:nucleotide-binding universal stress UspA family protein